MFILSFCNNIDSDSCFLSLLAQGVLSTPPQRLWASANSSCAVWQIALCTNTFYPQLLGFAVRLKVKENNRNRESSKQSPYLLSNSFIRDPSSHLMLVSVSRLHVSFSTRYSALLFSTVCTVLLKINFIFKLAKGQPLSEYCFYLTGLWVSNIFLKYSLLVSHAQPLQPPVPMHDVQRTYPGHV